MNCYSQLKQSKEQPTALTRWRTSEFITNWRQFREKIRSKNNSLLKKIDEFPDCVLVTGCQRSGTTLLTRILVMSEGMVNYWFGPDDELDAALILSDYVEHSPMGRYCFQTTYINARYPNYFEHDGQFKVLWVLRNPFSVVFSMLKNWPDDALNELFASCGVPILHGTDYLMHKLMGYRGLSKLRQACWAYKGKTSQLFRMRQHLGSTQLMIIDYDELVTKKEVILPAIYDFINLEYRHEYCERIHSRSISKAKDLSKSEIAIIRSNCYPLYQKAKQVCTVV